MGFLDKLLLFSSGAQPQPVPSAATSVLPTLKKVLVVEAEENLKNFYTQLFQTEKYEVAAVGNGAEGLNMLLTFGPDLILLDLMLPVMDGKSMLHHLRALPQYKKTPVIVISETGDTDTIRQVKVYDNASAFFIKSTLNPQDIIDIAKLLL